MMVIRVGLENLLSKPTAPVRVNPLCGCMWLRLKTFWIFFPLKVEIKRRFFCYRPDVSVQWEPARSRPGFSGQQLPASGVSLQRTQRSGRAAQSCAAGWTLSKPHPGVFVNLPLEARRWNGDIRADRRIFWCFLHLYWHSLLTWVFILICYWLQVKKGVVTKGGRFRPNNLSFRTLTGPVLLHRSSVNRSDSLHFHQWFRLRCLQTEAPGGSGGSALKMTALLVSFQGEWKSPQSLVDVLQCRQV